MSKINKSFLSIVIPVYNEQRRMPNNLDRIIMYLNKKKFKYEIIVIDDGSIDKTWEILEAYKKKYSNIAIEKHLINKGKGAAVRTGMLRAKGELVLMTDCDLSTPIEEIEKLMPHVLDYDVVIGSRRIDDNKVERRPERYRTLLGSAYYEMLRFILLPGIKDTNCGFKLYTKKAVRAIFIKQKINGWGYDAETLFLAKKNNLLIKEIPVRWTHYSGSKVQIYKAITQTLLEVALIKFYSFMGKYK